MPETEIPTEPVVEELRSLNEQADEMMDPYEVTLRQMMLTCAAVLTEAGGCASCVAILRRSALAGVSTDETVEPGEGDEGEPTCQTTRGRYRCARPPFHIPSDLHACTDGKMTAFWRDHEHKVTLKMKPSDEVLALLRGARVDSEEAETPA
jgi:hypothetical protein